MIISLVQEQTHHDYIFYFRNQHILIISLVEEQKHHDFIISTGAKAS